MWHILSFSIMCTMHNIQFIRWKAMNFPFSRVDSHVNDRWTIFKLILIWILVAVIALYGVNSFLPLQCCYNANLDNLLSFIFFLSSFSRFARLFFDSLFFIPSNFIIQQIEEGMRVCLITFVYETFFFRKGKEGYEVVRNRISMCRVPPIALVASLFSLLVACVTDGEKSWMNCP